MRAVGHVCDRHVLLARAVEERLPHATSNFAVELADGVAAPAAPESELCQPHRLVAVTGVRSHPAE